MHSSLQKIKKKTANQGGGLVKLKQDYYIKKGKIEYEKYRKRNKNDD